MSLGRHTGWGLLGINRGLAVGSSVLPRARATTVVACDRGGSVVGEGEMER